MSVETHKIKTSGKTWITLRMFFFMTIDVHVFAATVFSYALQSLIVKRCSSQSLKTTGFESFVNHFSLFLVDVPHMIQRPSAPPPPAENGLRKNNDDEMLKTTVLKVIWFRKK